MAVVVSGQRAHHDATGTTYDIFCRPDCMGSLRLHLDAETTKKTANANNASSDTRPNVSPAVSV